jgi:hypothetical protein
MGITMRAPSAVEIFGPNVALDRRFLLALANDDTPLNALAQAHALRKILSAVNEAHRGAVRKAWDDASTEALNHLAIVIKNNPAKTMEQILKRPDVISALSAPYEAAADKAGEIIAEAHAQAVGGIQKATGSTSEPDPSLLRGLIKDLHANAGAMRARIEEILLGYEKHPKDVKATLKGVTSDASNRAVMSLHAAVWMPASQMMHKAVDQQQILPKPKKGQKKAKPGKKPTKLMWVAIIDDKTCSTCKAMHGTKVKPGSPFKIDIAVYAAQAMRGGISGPPAHPHCRCILIPV